MPYGDGPADAALSAAWEGFCDQLKQAGQSAFKAANPANPLQRADAFRFLTQNLGQAFDLALETRDPAFPQIHPFCTPTRKLGGDVADFTYRQAWISGDHAYRITGRRGTARFFNVTVQGERPAAMANGNAPLHEPFGDTPQANIFGHQLQTDADGQFTLTIGGPPQPQNWLPTTPTSRKLFIREGFDSWDEVSTPLTIERIGRTEAAELFRKRNHHMSESVGFRYGCVQYWRGYVGGVQGAADRVHRAGTEPERFEPGREHSHGCFALNRSCRIHKRRGTSDELLAVVPLG